MVFTFILFIPLIALAWVLVRFGLSRHEGLQAVASFALIWGTFVFGFLIVGQVAPSAHPYDYLASVVSGIIIITIGVWYFLPKREPPITRPTSGFRFYHSRDELPDIKKVLDSAKDEIILVGGTLEIVKNRGEVFDAILKRDEPRVKIKLFLMDGESPHIAELEKATGQEGIAPSIDATLHALCSIRKGLSDLQRERLEIRTFKMIPLSSLMIIDRKSIRVEPYIYGIKGAGARPSFEYPKSDYPDEFARYWNGYEQILSDSVEYKCDDRPKVKPAWTG